MMSVASTIVFTLLAAESCSEFLVHGVDVEGKQLGIDEELVELLGQAAPLPVTYAGGVRSLVRPCLFFWQLRSHGTLISALPSFETCVPAL